MLGCEKSGLHEELHVLPELLNKLSKISILDKLSQNSMARDVTQLLEWLCALDSISSTA